MPVNKVRCGIQSAVLGIAFVGLAVLVNGGDFRYIDAAVVEALNAPIGREYGGLLSMAPIVGSPEVTGFAVALIFACIYFLRHRVPLGLSLFAALFVIEFLGKWRLVQPTPSTLMIREIMARHLPAPLPISLVAGAVLLVTAVLVDVLIRKGHPVLGWSIAGAIVIACLTGISLLSVNGSTRHFLHYPSLFLPKWIRARLIFSFPSGHMARATFVCLALLASLGLRKTPAIWKLLGALPVAMFLIALSFSLVSVGWHWFSDVLGGIALGGSVACLAEYLDGTTETDAADTQRGVPARDEPGRPNL